MTEALLINKFNTEKYRFEREGYVIRCTAIGDYTPKDAETFIKIARAYFSTIEDIHKCTLIVDARRQNVLRKEVLPYLEEVENLYMNTPFKERKFLPLYDAKANMQVISMAGKRFYEMFEPIEEEELEETRNINSDALEELHAMEAEFQAIVNDINLHPEHVGDYDLFGMVKEMEERSVLVSEKSKHILDSNNIEKIEKQAILKMSKMDKEELKTFKTLLVTIFDTAILKE
ncbi:MAG: hypothetical protein N4A63_12405 [Vallitalea sp.]|jgi:hypothetical protein|nr:hypothetical protein [Vallitalea sp.]